MSMSMPMPMSMSRSFMSQIQMIDSDALDVILKAGLVCAIVVTWISPIQWLAKALNDAYVKIVIIVAILLISVEDPVLAIIMTLFLITVILSGKRIITEDKTTADMAEKKKNALLAKSSSAAAAAAADIELPSGPLAAQWVAPDFSDGIPGIPKGSHPENPPLGWSADPIAPPTADQAKEILQECSIDDHIPKVSKTRGASSFIMDVLPDDQIGEDILKICNIPDETLKGIQDNIVPRSATWGRDLNQVEDDDTGRCLVNATTMLL